jgi:hypothetical protein
MCQFMVITVNAVRSSQKNFKCPSVEVFCDEVTEPSMLHEHKSSCCSTSSISAASGTFFPQDKCIFCGKKYNGKGESFATCVARNAEIAIKEAAKKKNDFIMLGKLSSEDLRVREA